MIRLCGDRLAIGIGGSGRPAEIAQHRAVIVEKIRVLRGCPHRLLDQRHAIGVAPGLVQQKPEEVQRRRMVTLRRQYLAVNRLGFLYPPRLVQR